MEIKNQKLKSIIYHHIIFIILIIIYVNAQNIPRESIAILKVNKGKDTSIMSRDSNCSLPDEVYINGDNQTEIKYNYDFTESSTVKLIWRKNIYSGFKMFFSCVDIIELNLTEFDSSLITDMGYMFMQMRNLTLLDLSNFNTRNCVNMRQMFDDDGELESLDLSGFDTSKVTEMFGMFYNCIKLKTIKISNFINSNVFNTSKMFSGCQKLENLNLTNFYTPEVINMELMFNNCASLKYLDLKNFKTSKVENINSMFGGCEKLTYLHLSNFNISKTINMNNMFNRCSSLEFLNLENSVIKNDNFYIVIINGIISEYLTIYANNDTEWNKYFNHYFTINCDNYKQKIFYYNITKQQFSCKLCDLSYYYQIVDDKSNFNNSYIDCLQKIPEGYYLSDINNKNAKQCYKTCKVCEKEGTQEIHNCLECKENYNFELNMDNFKNCYDKCEYYYYLDNISNKSYCTKNYKCPEYYYKLIPGKNECISDCNRDPIYKYEYNNTCFNISKIELNEDISDILSTDINKEKYTNDSHEIILYSLDKFIQILNLNDTFEKVNNTLTKKSDLNSKIINNILKGTMNTILTQIKSKNCSIVIEDDSGDNHLLSTLSNNLNRVDYSSIDFGECEKILRNKSGIESDEELILYEIEHNIEGLKIPVIEYTLFSSDGYRQLNLSLCDNLKVKYNIPVNISENDLEQYDPESDFYQDPCSKYNENGVDVTLYDRKNSFNNNNMSLCEKGCSFIKYNTETSKAECDCNVKNDMSYNDNKNNNGELINKIESHKSNNNLGVTQCLTNVELKTNSGFISLLIIVIIFIIVFIIFCIKGKNNLEQKLNEEIYNKFEKQQRNEKCHKAKKNRNAIKLDGGKIHIKKENIKLKSKLTKDLKKRTNLFNSSSKGYIKQKTQDNINNLNLKDNKANLPIIEDIPNQDNDYEMNNLSYPQALKYDKRTFCDYYCSLQKNKQLFMFTFCSFNDYNSGIIKKFIFFLSFAVHYTINALFFTDEVMHKILEDEGSYNFSFHLPRILISTVASIIFLRLILEMLVLTDRSVLEVKHQTTKILANEMKIKILKCVNLKYAIFFILNFILLILFWFYLTCFNGVYENTQIVLIENTFISFGFSLFYPILWNIIPAIFRMVSLNDKNSDKSCLYNTSKFFQII